MDNTFKISRFGKYFVYDLKRQWKNIGMLMLIFALSPVIFYMLYMFFAALFDGGLMKLFSGMSIDGPSIWVRFGMAAVMITIFVMLFPSRAYGEITNKAKGSEWLMLPASRLEKFTSMMLISLIVIPLVYVVVYFSATLLSACSTSPAVIRLCHSESTRRSVHQTLRSLPTASGFWPPALWKTRSCSCSEA